MGSVFSPYYAWSGRRRPENHCALNAVLFGSHKRWAMTERGERAVRRTADEFTVGPSRMHWDGRVLTVDIDEVTAPIPSRIRGRVRLYSEAVNDHAVVLDEAGRHCWWPIAPRARIEVDLDAPKLRWAGWGYFDSNWGDVAPERTFRRWDWCRASVGDGTAVLYDLAMRSGETCSLAILFDPAQAVVDFPTPPAVRLPRTLWGVGRGTRSEAPATARVERTLLDAPFYARSVIGTRLFGQDVQAIHESVSLDRQEDPDQQYCDISKQEPCFSE